MYSLAGRFAPNLLQCSIRAWVQTAQHCITLWGSDSTALQYIVGFRQHSITVPCGVQTAQRNITVPCGVQTAQHNITVPCGVQTAQHNITVPCGVQTAQHNITVPCGVQTAQHNITVPFFLINEACPVTGR
jgi:hypothetical protein